MEDFKRGFFFTKIRNCDIGFGMSIMYSAAFEEFCIWIHIGVFSFYIGYNFSAKEEQP